MKKTLKYTLNIITYGFIGIVLMLIILSLIGIKPYITISGSMEPNIKTGSVCFVNTKAKYESVQVDDIIAFKTGGMLVTHRAVNLTPNGIETKGDNNEDMDTFVTNNNNFVGKTMFSIPYAGYIVMFFKKPFGLSIIIAILLVLVFLT